MLKKILRSSAALGIVLGLGLAFTAYDTAPAFAQSTKSQKAKKPASSCEEMDKASKAYSDCVKAQAQTTKDAQQSATKEKGKKTKSP